MTPLTALSALFSITLPATAAPTPVVTLGWDRIAIKAHEDYCVAPESLAEGARILIKPCVDVTNATRSSLSQLGQVMFPRGQTTPLCADIGDNGLYNGGRLSIATCSDDRLGVQSGFRQERHFPSLTDTSDWWFSVYVEDSAGKAFCLDVTDGNFQEGTEMQFWECNPTAPNDNQKLIGIVHVDDGSSTTSSSNSVPQCTNSP
jgi:hypothetical protein